MNLSSVLFPLFPKLSVIRTVPAVRTCVTKVIGSKVVSTSKSRGTNFPHFTLAKKSIRSSVGGIGLEPARNFSTCLSFSSWVNPATGASSSCNPWSSPDRTVILGIVRGQLISAKTMSSACGSSEGKLKIVIFYGSSRPGRMVDRVGSYIKEKVEAHGMEAIILDPEVLPMEILKVPLHFYPKPEQAPEWLRENEAKIRGADGFLILSSEYNCGIPPALSNLIDHFPPAAYRHRPVGIVTYSMGSMGGVRASVILRPKVSDIGMLAVPSSAMIPTVQNAFSAEGKCLEDRVAKNIEKVIEDLEWYSTAIKNHKAVKEPLPGPTY